MRDLEHFVKGWTRRRWARTALTVFIACASAFLHWGEDDTASWIVLGAVAALAVYDLFFSIRREVKAWSNANPSQYGDLLA
jgi:hypothetical protein